jgi:hypothetical protein
MLNKIIILLVFLIICTILYFLFERIDNYITNLSNFQKKQNKKQNK